MAYELLEFSDLTAQGDPVFPELHRTTAAAFDAAILLDPATRLIAIVPAADMRIRVSVAGTAAGATDPKIEASKARSLYIRRADIMYVYGVAA